jgi:hypothetical protein
MISLLISHKFLITGSYTQREHEDLTVGEEDCSAVHFLIIEQKKISVSLK